MGKYGLAIWTLLAILPFLSAQWSERTYIDPHIHLMVHGITEISPKADVSRIFDGKNYSIDTFDQVTKNTPVKYTVVMEAAIDSLAEIDYILKESCTHESIVGVIGGIPLESPNFEELLDKYEARRGCGMLVGLRNWVKHGNDYYESEKLWPAVKILERRGLTLDLLVRPYELKNLSIIPENFPHLKIILCHQAYPTYREDMLQTWYNGIESIAKYPNVNIKLSSFLTTAEMNELFRSPNPVPSIRQSRFDLYQDKVKHIIKHFGVDRVIYASNWPVDLLGADNYHDIYSLAANLTEYLPQEDRDKIFRDNCIRIYNVRMKHPPCKTDHCESRPCRNGGSCYGNPSGYLCSCAPGYTGYDCGGKVDKTTNGAGQFGGGGPMLNQVTQAAMMILNVLVLHWITFG